MVFLKYIYIISNLTFLKRIVRIPTLYLRYNMPKDEWMTHNNFINELFKHDLYYIIVGMIVSNIT